MLQCRESLRPLGRATQWCGEATRAAASQSLTLALLANSANQLSLAQGPSTGPPHTRAV